MFMVVLQGLKPSHVDLVLVSGDSSMHSRLNMRALLPELTRDKCDRVPKYTYAFACSDKGITAEGVRQDAAITTRCYGEGVVLMSVSLNIQDTYTFFLHRSTEHENIDVPTSRQSEVPYSQCRTYVDDGYCHLERIVTRTCRVQMVA